MRILDLRHVREAALAEIAADGQARERLSPTDRQHIEMCDRCQGLIVGHGRAARALAAPWHFQTAAASSSERGVQRVSVDVSGGRAIGPVRLSTPILLIVAAMLAMALVGSVILAGGSGPSDSSTLAVVPAASTTPTPSPSPRPLDTSVWFPFVSPHYGLTVSAPADWGTQSARMPWDVAVDQPAMSSYLLDTSDLLEGPDGSKLFAAYGMAIPEGMTSDAFIEAYRGRHVRWDVDCFPPPSRWEHALVDGHIAGLVDVCYYIDAIVVVERRAYVFSGYNDLASDRELFDLLLSTVRLDPASADPDFAPTSSPSPAS